MFSKLMTVVMAFAFLTSCQSTLPQNKKPLVFVPIPPPYDLEHLHSIRVPASTSNSKILDYYVSSHFEIVNEVLKEAKLEAIANEHDSQKTLGHYLEALSQVSLSSQVLIEKFDKEITTHQNYASLFEIDSYNELIQNWMIHERMENQIYYVTQSLLNMEADPAHTENQTATKVLTYTRNIWQKIAQETGSTEKISFENKARRLLFQDIFKGLDEKIQTQIETFKSNNPNSEIPRNFQQTLRIVQDLKMTDAQEKVAVQTMKKEIRTFAQQSASFSSPWLNAIRQTMNLKGNYPFLKTKREPKSVSAICPSADGVGYISGSYFPVGSWAMTLDDGPHKTYTPIMKKAFTDNGVKGTFFWLAQLTTTLPDTVAGIKADGHTLATHSYSHANLPTLGADGLNKEIITANKINTEVYGYRPKFFRCPYGACGKAGGKIRQMIADEGQVHVFWNIDSLDWKDKDPDSIVQRVLAQYDSISKKSGGVILFHDVHSQSAEAVTKLIPILIKRGAKFETIENIVAKQNEASGTTCPKNWTPHAQ